MSPKGEEMAMLSRWIVTIVLTAALMPGVSRGEVAGKWVAELTSPTLLEPAYIRVVLAQTGDTVSGAWGTEIVKGIVKGSTVSLALTDTAGRDAGTLTGKIEGDAGGGGGTMAGVGGRGGRGGAGSGARAPVLQEVAWKLTREPTPPAKPREVNYEPTTFQAYYYAG